MNKEYLIYKLSDEVKNSCKIDKEAFKKFNVKRGLRNEDGSGVLVGLGEKHYGIVNLCTFMIRHGTGAVCFVEHLKYLGFFQVNKITAVFNL